MISVRDTRLSPAPLLPTGADPDDPDAAFALIESGARAGIAGALLTITGILGGAPRSIGTQMAVLADGRYCGQLSGGCVEAAVASAALVCLARGRDETLRIGAGSPLVDVRLPCGGGINVHVHTRPDIDIVLQTRRLLRFRQSFSVELALNAMEPMRLAGSAIGERSRSQDGRFIRHYHPRTRLVLIGGDHEMVAIDRIATAAGFPVFAFAPVHGATLRESAANRFSEIGTNGLKSTEMSVDQFTAVAILLHDFAHEIALINGVMAHKPFYIGVLGSARTHARRVSRLRDAGLAEEDIQTLHGPIGLFGPTRTRNDLAISILADISQSRIKLDG